MKDLFRKAVHLVREAGKIAKDDALREIVSEKNKNDFVTAVDTGISSFMKKELRLLTPDAGFFSEEEAGALSDPCWILDPIDGTTNLIYGYGLSSVSLAYYEGGEVVFGIVYNPFTKETFLAEKGRGATLNGKPIKVSRRQMKDALIEFGAGSTRKSEADANFAVALSVFRECVDIRRICSSALDLCYIACGRIDGYFEKVLKPWDVAAGSLILAEAGGVATDYAGKPIDFSAPTSIVAGNGIVNETLLAKLGGR